MKPVSEFTQTLRVAERSSTKGLSYARAGIHPGVFHPLPRTRIMLASEAAFAEQIGNAITTNPHFSGRKLRIETEDGRVVLLGTVRSYYQKQMAQEAIRHVEGVRGIDNRLTVLA